MRAARLTLFAIVVTAAVVLIVCIVFVRGVWRDGFVGEILFNVRGTSYAISSHALCVLAGAISALIAGGVVLVKLGGVRYQTPPTHPPA